MEIGKNGGVDTLPWVRQAIADYNQEVEESERLSDDVDLVLFGRDGCLDSLGLVNLVIHVEQTVARESGVALTLADERAMSQKHNPFRTVGALAEFVAERLREEKVA